MQINSDTLMQLGTLQQQSSRTDSQISAMQRAGGEDVGQQRKEELMQACKDFQAIFVKKMLDSMRKTVHESGMLDGGRAEEIFEDMLYDSYAEKMSNTAGLGLDTMIYRELTGRAPDVGAARRPAPQQQDVPSGGRSISDGSRRLPGMVPGLPGSS
jgi:Rod binding domain-containing protein